MNWQLLCTHPWQRPLDLAQDLCELSELALLYSGREEAHTGRYSFLFAEAAQQATGSHWRDLPPIATTDDLPDWVGYLGYGMRADDGFARSAPAPIDLPDFWLTRYQRMLRFDHQEEVLEEFGRYHATSPLTFSSKESTLEIPTIAELHSNLTRQQYETCVRATIEAIEAGDFYQANMTRKFYGSFAQKPDSLALFKALCAASAAPYSAYIKHGETAILSASPECFLSISADGTITSRPIKGSIRRGLNEAEDTALRKALSSSDKNLAENLMIVDLMRNDLAQVSEVGSVEVAEQSGLYSYATIHHLVSTVKAKKLASASCYDVARACFPPGSMTGAPKHAAVTWCNAQEKMERGVYSGAMGWFGAQNCDLSVVIRTILVRGEQFEFQVGGGIVAESTAEDEWRETLVKARGIAKALHIDERDLERL